MGRRSACVWVCAAALVAARTDATVDISGLRAPTSFTWDDQGRVYISEKAGIIKVASGWTARNTSVLVNVTSQVADYGDMGMTSIDVAGNYVYATYMVSNPTIGDSCTDFGVVGDRSPAQVLGCRTHGRVSRWSVSASPGAPAGVSVGAEEVLYDGVNTTCAQFNAGPIDYVLVGTDGNVYFSAGAGADTNAVDFGQFGGNPCVSPSGSAWGGAFRSQDSATHNGKLIRLNPATGETTIVAQGFNNPWRFAFAGATSSQVYIADTGVFKYEEVNGPVALAPATTAPNFGWPCREGPDVAQPYSALGSPVCANTSGMRDPFFSYSAPDNSTAVSISALTTQTVGAHTRVYVGDYSLRKIFSINAQNASDVWDELTQVIPVDMAFVPGQGLVMVSYFPGRVLSVNTRPLTPAASGVADALPVGVAALLGALVLLMGSLM